MKILTLLTTLSVDYICILRKMLDMHLVFSSTIDDVSQTLESAFPLPTLFANTSFQKYASLSKPLQL